MSRVETSPGGVGYIATRATKKIPGLVPDGAKRRDWLVEPARPAAAAALAHPLRPAQA